jgi:hypothetical protein
VEGRAGQIWQIASDRHLDSRRRGTGGSERQAMSDPKVGSPPSGSRYADQRPYVAVDRLAELRGPTGGVVRLDRRLYWSGRGTYDLDNPRRLANMYETVLREASRPEELARWLDGGTLVRLWSDLVLPPQLRQLWETRFPELACARPPSV